MNTDNYWAVAITVTAVLFLIVRPRRRRRFRYGRHSSKRYRQRPFQHWRTPDRHKVTQKDAEQALQQLAKLSHPGSRFNFLRRINHFVFEELILTALEQKGHRVIRNSRYTGDGGIDGKVIVQGKTVLIQAKRYSGTVSRTDVAVFGQLCREQGVTGWFVHTGKTPKATWHDLRALHPHISIISGERLLAMLSPDAALDAFGT